MKGKSRRGGFFIPHLDTLVLTIRIISTGNAEKGKHLSEFTLIFPSPSMRGNRYLRKLELPRQSSAKLAYFSKTFFCVNVPSDGRGAPNFLQSLSCIKIPLLLLPCQCREARRHVSSLPHSLKHNAISFLITMQIQIVKQCTGL